MPENSVAIEIAGVTIAPASRRRIEIPVSRLPTETWLTIPVEVINGRQAGPRLWLSAAVHGDELNGVEIIRRVLEQVDPGQLKGAVVAVPIVNVFGFMEQSRYLPDRRDLNRCFPGSSRGSLASRLAHLLMTEVVKKCTHGIDLHTGSNHRANLPQIRANLSDPVTRRCAEAFAAGVLIHSLTRDGSLRQAAATLGLPMLLYEGGEPLRFDAQAIRVGTRGVLRVMAELGMRRKRPKAEIESPVEIGKTTWVRARRSGIFRVEIELGHRVRKGDRLGIIADALCENQSVVKAPKDGLVIGVTKNPLVNQGDAIVHIGIPAASARE